MINEIKEYYKKFDRVLILTDIRLKSIPNLHRSCSYEHAIFVTDNQSELFAAVELLIGSNIPFELQAMDWYNYYLTQFDGNAIYKYEHSLATKDVKAIQQLRRERLTIHDFSVVKTMEILNVI